MGFYGNSIIETTKSFTDLKVFPTIDTTNPEILSPGVIRSELFIAPGDPWVGLEAIAPSLQYKSDAQLFIFHTSTEQRLNNSLAPGQGITHEERGIIAPTAEDIENGTDVRQLFINKYCNVMVGNNPEKQLALGDTFSAIVPGTMIGSDGQTIKNIIVDKAGHLINASLVTYKLPTTAGLSYEKDKWVTTLYGDPDWYTNQDNINKYKFPNQQSSTGLIQDLYNKIDTTIDTLSDNDSETYSLKDLLSLIKHIEVLSKQMDIIYTPDIETNKSFIIDGERIPASNLIKTILSIRDMKTFKDNSENNDDIYLDTFVIQILQTILACNYNTNDFNLTTDIPILGKLQQLEEIIKVMEYFFGLSYQETVQDAPNVYVEVKINKDEFEINSSNYYISVNNQMQHAESTFHSNVMYFERAKKYLIEVQASDAIFDYNYNSLYVRHADGTYRLNTDRTRLVTQTYYLYTKYNISRLLDEFRVTINGRTSTDLVGYIQKLNSAR